MTRLSISCYLLALYNAYCTPQTYFVVLVSAGYPQNVLSPLSTGGFWHTGSLNVRGFAGHHTTRHCCPLLQYVPQSSSLQTPATYCIPLSNIIPRCSNHKWLLDICTKHSLIISEFKFHLALLVYEEFVKSVTDVTIIHITLSSGKSWYRSQVSWKGKQCLPITILLDLTSIVQFTTAS